MGPTSPLASLEATKLEEGFRAGCGSCLPWRSSCVSPLPCTSCAAEMRRGRAPRRRRTSGLPARCRLTAMRTPTVHEMDLSSRCSSPWCRIRGLTCLTSWTQTMTASSLRRSLAAPWGCRLQRRPRPWPATGLLREWAHRRTSWRPCRACRRCRLRERRTRPPWLRRSRAWWESRPRGLQRPSSRWSPGPSRPRPPEGSPSHPSAPTSSMLRPACGHMDNRQ
mmetsp:Transcript_69906/g.208318  ORF Transcript_69906/g.208318 Transcript_69906/m.208318 type:complete len:222 (-) Transcript_69906:108-773(-)